MSKHTPKQICPECGKPVYQSYGWVIRHRKCQGLYIGSITKKRWKKRDHQKIVNAQFAKPLLSGETMRVWLKECESEVNEISEPVKVEVANP